MFSQTVEYALRAVMCVAGADGVPASSERISDEMQIPRAYLSKIMRGLVVGKIVESLLGPNGGFVLARSVDRVSVLDVVNAVDPIGRIRECPLGKPEHVRLCPLHRQMDQAMAHVEQTLRSVTIGQLKEMDDDMGVQGLVQPAAPVRRARRGAKTVRP